MPRRSWSPPAPRRTGAQPHDYTAADQLLARSAVLTQRDVGRHSVWRGGSIKPDDSFNPVCPSFHLRRADLVVTGEAESRYATTAAEVADSKAQVLRTAEMVQLDVQADVDNPALVTCLRALAAGEERCPSTRLSPPAFPARRQAGFDPGSLPRHEAVDADPPTCSTC